MRDRETIAWCKERGIGLTRPALEHPPKDTHQARAAKRQEHQYICDRNPIEGEFGIGKRNYGLGRTMDRFPETALCVIGISLQCMNLTKRHGSFFACLVVTLGAWVGGVGEV